MLKSRKTKLLSIMLIIAMLIGMLPSNLIVVKADETQLATTSTYSLINQSPKNPSNGQWDYVSFGSYPQSEVEYYSADIINGALMAGNKGTFYVGANKYKRLNDATVDRGFRVFKYEPIKWRVLRNDGEKLLLLSEYILCNRIRNDPPWGGTVVYWDGCDLREYLNGGFVEDAFNGYEQNKLIETKLANPYYPATNGNEGTTYDKVWIPSRYDMDIEDYGFKTTSDRTAFESDYAELERLNSGNNKSVNYAMRSLRSASNALVYDNAGGYYTIGTDTYCGVRPAIMIPVNTPAYKNTTLEETVPLSFYQDNYGYQIQNQFSNLNYDAGTLKGPEVEIMGEKINLFNYDMKVELALGDDSQVKGSVKYDPEKQTVKYMLGITDEEKALLDASVNEPGDSRWQESYDQLKTYIKNCKIKKGGNKLHNDFRKLKSKLRKTNASFGLKTEGYIAGYLEFSVANGELEFVEGAITATMETSVKVKTPIVANVIYMEVGMGGEVGSELVIKKESMECFSLEGKVNLALKPSAGIVADLKVIEGKAIFSGDIGLDINFPFKSPEESIQGYIQGKFTLSVNSPMNIIKFSMTKKYPKMELYPNLGEIIEESSVMRYNMRLLSAAVDEIPTEGLIEFAERNKETPVYEDAKPQLVELSDGRKLLIYIDDDGTKSEGNHTTLMYSIQENGVWSAPAAVNETGRADSAPVIHYDGTGVHVIWLNVSVEVTEEQLEEVLSNVDLCYAYFDGTEFGETTVISEADNGKIEYYYSIAAKEGETTIMWVDNSENDFMMTSGTNTVYKRIITEEGLGDITTAASATTKITQTACDYISDTLYSAYIKNGELYVGSTSYKSKATNVSNIEYIDDKLYYLNDTLKYYNNSKSIDTGVVPSSRFTVVGDRVFWLDYDGDYCEIFVQTIGQDNVAMVTDDNGHINSMSVIEKADGDTAIAYIYQNLNVNFEDDVNPFGTSFMKYYEEKEMYDLSIENVSYDFMDIENGGEMSIDFDIRNNGVTDIEGAVLKLYNPYYEVIKEVAIEDVIASGNSITSSVTITLPEDISDYCVIVTVGNDNISENVLDNNSCTLELENTDVSMVMDETYGVEIENIGNCTAGDVSLYVYEDSAYGEIIKQIDIGEMTPGQKVSYSDEELIEAFDFEGIDDINYYYYVVKTSSIDVNEGNNSDIKTRRPIAAEKVILSSELVEMYLGDSVDIVAEISPDNAYFKDVIWTSSNEKVATVDDNGKVKAVSAGVAFIRAETKAEGVFALAAVSVVKKKDISVGSIGNYVYSGSEITPEIKVYSDGIRLYENRDYTLEYANNKNAGTAKVIVTGIGDYQGTVNKTFTIAKKNISGMKAVLSNSKYTYNGKAKKPTVTISGLEEGTDYTISYSSNIKPGKATVTITGKGNYTGTITNSFTILPSQVKSPKQVTASTYTTKMKLTWGKCTGVTGYEIYRSTSKNGTYKKVKTITSNTNSSTITGLKAGTKYYYKVRAYKTVDGQKIYGTFSTVLQTVTKPKAPTSIKVLPATKKATVTWTKATGAVGYEVYMATSKNGTYKKIGATTSALKYVKAGLTSGKKYYYKVRAYTKTSAGTKLYSGFTSVKSVTVK